MAVNLLYRGAEAELLRTEWHGRDAVVKHRVPKSYRHADIDRRLRTARTREEALLFRAAREAGVGVPTLFDVDLADCALTMEFVNGPMLKVALEESSGSERAGLARAFGRSVAMLHRAGVVHGDLTTSNVLVQGGGLVFIDFGLGARTREPEDRGVDLHLLMEALESTHAAHRDLYGLVVEGYREGTPFARGVEKVVQDIVRRGRYRSEKG